MPVVPTLDPWQPSLLAGGDRPAVNHQLVGARRTLLDDTSWVDHVPAFVGGADALFDRLVTSAAWRQPEVTMYDVRMPQPRLSAAYPFDDDLPAEPVLDDIRMALAHQYGHDFDSVGLSLYRDGRDSVAWHRDRHHRHVTNPVVATVSLGSARPFLVRPLGGGPSRRFLPGPGDLLVMGGASQHHWEHAVPKVAHAGPRLSIVFRHDTGRASSRVNTPQPSTERSPTIDNAA